MSRIPVNSELLTWARERAGIGRRALAAWRFVFSCGEVG